MPIVKKNTAASAAAKFDDGLAVKTVRPVKASKAAPKAATGVKTTSKVTKPTPAKPAAAVKATKPAASDKPLWTDTSDRTAAHRAVVRHVGDNGPAIKGTQSYWAEANRDVKRYNKVVAAKGSWHLAFDTMVGTTPTTVIFDQTGTEVFRAKMDDEDRLATFTYWD